MKATGLVQQLRSTLFWDVDPRGMDAEAHKGFIIPRVMDRGNHADVLAVWKHYGADAVREVLLSAPSLDQKTIHFFANQFGLNPEHFRAYRRRRELGTWML